MQKTVKKTSVCFILCFFVVFKTVLFLPRRQRAGPGPTGNGPGRAGLGLIFLERQRAGPGLSWTGRAGPKKTGPCRPLACTHLSSTVSQLFKPQVQKIAVFTYRSPHTPEDAPMTIMQYVPWMKRQFNACQTPRSMYPSIFDSFLVIPTASAKNRRFHVPQPTFLFPLETPLRLSRNMFHGWKVNSMLAKPLAACTYLSSIVSELYDA